jgi:hypothetical protein
MIKIFENFGNDYEVLATNEVYWRWEYDAITVTAKILLDKTDNSLYLKINSVHTKSGLGAGVFPKQLEFINIGNLQKADLALVRTLLSKHALQQKFSRFWEDKEGNKLSLGDLIKLLKPEKPKRELKHIKPITTFEEPNIQNIELVKYSDKSYALFGLGTKDIKDQLIALGCRYNKFLTHPETGEKKAGWIFSNNKLDKIKEII